MQGSALNISGAAQGFRIITSTREIRWATNGSAGMSLLFQAIDTVQYWSGGCSELKAALRIRTLYTWMRPVVRVLDW
jgi:hypothetical protein